jgi:hypothetical protein
MPQAQPEPGVPIVLATFNETGLQDVGRIFLARLRRPD